MSSPLLDQQFKKIAKGVYRGLAQAHPSVKSAGYNTFLQLFSQRIFSMPYEEAKATVLKEGASPTAVLSGREGEFEQVGASLVTSPVSKESAGDAQQMMLCPPALSLASLSAALSATSKDEVEDSCLVTLLQLFMCFQVKAWDDTLLRNSGFAELVDRVYETLHRCGYSEADIDALVSRAPKLNDNDDGGVGMWEGRAATGIEALHRSMVYLIDFDKRMFTVDHYYDAISLRAFVEMAMDKKIPKMLRSGLHTVLSSINYRHVEGKWDEHQQNIATLEQFDYIMMQSQSRYRQLHNAYNVFQRIS